jgi:FkbM family methyltransferase
MKTEEILLCLEQASKRRAALARLPFTRRLLKSPQMSLLTMAAKVLRVNKSTYQKSTKTFWGAPMNVVLPEVVSSEIARFGYIEMGVARMMIDHVLNGDVVFDVGAHFGFFSLLAAELTGPTGQVHAFEPVPSTAALLRANTAGRPVVVNNTAVWSESTKLNINDFGLSLSAFNSIRMPRFKETNPYKHALITVKAVSLDDYAKEHGLTPSFVKIDAESAEREVLIGMQRLIREVHPVICLEVGDLGVKGAAQSRQLVASLINQGYTALEFDGTGFRLHQLTENYGYSNLLFVPVT